MLETATLGGRRSGTILFVDDEPLSLKYFQASVGKYANVRTASSPGMAMSILDSEGEEISVVVSDERMPRESGVTFLSEVRKSWPSTVRVLTSAYANIDNLQHAINDAGIFRFVPKPWNLDQLCAAMQDALRVERSTAAVVEPLESASGGDAENANLALLAILASSLDSPLKALDAEALKLIQLSGPCPIGVSEIATPYLASWSSRLRQGKVAASATQIQRDVEHCKSLATSINRLARGLANPAVMQASSMAETLHEVIEQNTSGQLGGPTFDASNDFTYRVPREIMKFVLATLLRGSSAVRKSRALSPTKITLFAGSAHNEVRINLGPDHGLVSSDDNQSWRTIRSALWAFGGELLVSNDENLGKFMCVICLPRAA